MLWLSIVNLESCCKTFRNHCLTLLDFDRYFLRKKHEMQMCSAWVKNQGKVSILITVGDKRPWIWQNSIRNQSISSQNGSLSSLNPTLLPPPVCEVQATCCCSLVFTSCCPSSPLTHTFTRKTPGHLLWPDPSLSRTKEREEEERITAQFQVKCWGVFSNKSSFCYFSCVVSMMSL